MAIISVENVSLTIGTAQILRDISVSFEEGQIHGIIGRNGSGKTMLMKCICGFIRTIKNMLHFTVSTGWRRWTGSSLPY